MKDPLEVLPDPKSFREGYLRPQRSFIPAGIGNALMARKKNKVRKVIREKKIAATAKAIDETKFVRGEAYIPEKDLNNPANVLEEISQRMKKQALERGNTSEKYEIPPNLPEINSFDRSIRTKVLNTLQEKFKFDEFKPCQFEAILTVLTTKKDLFCCLPTSGGKSLIFQLSSLLFKGFMLVIMPTISLIEDQILRVKELNIPYLSTTERTREPGQKLTDLVQTLQNEQRKSVFETPFKVVFTTPEYLTSSDCFREILQEYHRHNLLSRIVIDEAHCVSEWGHDFRQSYLELKHLKNWFLDISLIALTATATPIIIPSIATILNLGKDCVYMSSSVNRANLRYSVERKASSYDITLLKEILKRYEGLSGIIYCSTKAYCDRLVNDLGTTIPGAQIRSYHSKKDPQERNANQRLWTEGKIKIIVATVAFGLGVDKKDVRFVIHFNTPKSLANYAQESGRAGRDNLISDCVLMYHPNDIKIQRTLSASNTVDENGMVKIQKKFISLMQFWQINQMRRYCEDNTICKRQLILKHFGQHINRIECDRKCDSCLSAGPVSLLDFIEHLFPILDFWLINYDDLKAVKITDKQFSKVLKGCSDKENKWGNKFGSLARTLNNYHLEEIEMFVSSLVTNDLFEIKTKVTNRNTIHYINLNKSMYEDFKAKCGYRTELKDTFKKVLSLGYRYYIQSPCYPLFKGTPLEKVGEPFVRCDTLAYIPDYNVTTYMCLPKGEEEIKRLSLEERLNNLDNQQFKKPELVGNKSGVSDTLWSKLEFGFFQDESLYKELFRRLAFIWRRLSPDIEPPKDALDRMARELNDGPSENFEQSFELPPQLFQEVRHFKSIFGFKKEERTCRLKYRTNIVTRHPEAMLSESEPEETSSQEPGFVAGGEEGEEFLGGSYNSRSGSPINQEKEKFEKNSREGAEDFIKDLLLKKSKERVVEEAKQKAQKLSEEIKKREQIEKKPQSPINISSQKENEPEEEECVEVENIPSQERSNNPHKEKVETTSFLPENTVKTSSSNPAREKPPHNEPKEEPSQPQISDSSPFLCAPNTSPVNMNEEIIRSPIMMEESANLDFYDTNIGLEDMLECRTKSNEKPKKVISVENGPQKTTWSDLHDSETEQRIKSVFPKDELSRNEVKNESRKSGSNLVHPETVKEQASEEPWKDLEKSNKKDGKRKEVLERMYDLEKARILKEEANRNQKTNLQPKKDTQKSLQNLPTSFKNSNESILLKLDRRQTVRNDKSKNAQEEKEPFSESNSNAILSHGQYKSLKDPQKVTVAGRTTPQVSNSPRLFEKIPKFFVERKEKESEVDNNYNPLASRRQSEGSMYSLASNQHYNSYLLPKTDDQSIAPKLHPGPQIPYREASFSRNSSAYNDILNKYSFFKNEPSEAVVKSVPTAKMLNKREPERPEKSVNSINSEIFSENRFLYNHLEDLKKPDLELQQTAPGTQTTQPPETEPVFIINRPAPSVTITPTTPNNSSQGQKDSKDQKDLKDPKSKESSLNPISDDILDQVEEVNQIFAKI